MWKPDDGCGFIHETSLHLRVSLSLHKSISCYIYGPYFANVAHPNVSLFFLLYRLFFIIISFFITRVFSVLFIFKNNFICLSVNCPYPCLSLIQILGSMPSKISHQIAMDNSGSYRNGERPKQGTANEDVAT